MSIPQIRTEAIEAVGRKILMEYDPSLLSGQPCPVPIETIIETKFDLILEFHTLRKNPKILGETIFDDGAVVLYDQIQRQYRMIAVRAGTILIDERLCDPSKLGRLRFTCAHELAHWVLHKKLYSGTGDVAAYVENIKSIFSFLQLIILYIVNPRCTFLTFNLGARNELGTGGGRLLVYLHPRFYPHLSHRSIRKGIGRDTISINYAANKYYILCFLLDTSYILWYNAPVNEFCAISLIGAWT